MTEALGSSFANRLLGVACAASLRRVTTAPQPPSPPSAGDPQAPTRRRRKRSRPHIYETPFKDPNAPDVRRLSRLVLEICSWLRPWKQRNGQRTGHEGQLHKLNKRNLSARLGVCTKEVERYLNVLEEGGIIRRWQPPASSGMPRGNISGHCFSVYELVGEMPAPLRLELEHWHGRAGKLERAELAALAVDVEAVETVAPAGPATGVYDSASALEAVRKLRGPP